MSKMKTFVKSVCVGYVAVAGLGAVVMTVVGCSSKADNDCQVILQDGTYFDVSWRDTDDGREVTCIYEPQSELAEPTSVVQWASGKYDADCTVTFTDTQTAQIPYSWTAQLFVKSNHLNFKQNAMFPVDLGVCQ